MLEVDEEGRSHFGGGEHDDDDDDFGGHSDGDEQGEDFFKLDKEDRKKVARAAKLAAVQGDERWWSWSWLLAFTHGHVELIRFLVILDRFFFPTTFESFTAIYINVFVVVVVLTFLLCPWGAAEGKDDDDDDEWAAFYGDVAGAAEARAKKRKAKYTPEQRLAGAHTSQLLAPGQKRAATYQIIKNRGLVAHKAKINRNPRVKKKEQFRKATIARKGQVRDIRDAGEGAHYGGEATGIRNNLTRSRKIEN